MDLDKIIVATGFGAAPVRAEEWRHAVNPPSKVVLGWPSKSGETVDGKGIHGNYEKDILSHAGVRLIGKSNTNLLLIVA